ncbi:hypothetical protein C8R43DRAFT_946768 [Mycena crocata]|nr:hypothetical protein C8R43DRAFT_946768 [Mycena crocata]
MWLPCLVPGLLFRFFSRWERNFSSSPSGGTRDIPPASETNPSGPVTAPGWTLPAAGKWTSNETESYQPEISCDIKELKTLVDYPTQFQSIIVFEILQINPKFSCPVFPERNTLVNDLNMSVKWSAGLPERGQIAGLLESRPMIIFAVAGSQTWWDWCCLQNLFNLPASAQFASFSGGGTRPLNDPRKPAAEREISFYDAVGGDALEGRIPVQVRSLSLQQTNGTGTRILDGFLVRGQTTEGTEIRDKFDFRFIEWSSFKMAMTRYTKSSQPRPQIGY